MITAVRAVGAVGLLLGFYLYAAAIVLLFGVPAGWLIARGQWHRQNTVQQRMRKLLAEVPVRELVTRPEHRFVPYEEIAAASLVRRIPATFDFVLRSGERLRIRVGRKSDEVLEGWTKLGQIVGMVGTPSSGPRRTPLPAPDRR